MREVLRELLQTEFGYSVRLQGSYSPAEQYPESFFTIWGSSEDGSHYDNDAIAFVWDYTVYFYSTNPQTVVNTLSEVRKLLKENGWIVRGKGYDVPSDEPTHTGRAIDVLFVEKND